MHIISVYKKLIEIIVLVITVLLFSVGCDKKGELWYHDQTAILFHRELEHDEVKALNSLLKTEIKNGHYIGPQQPLGYFGAFYHIRIGETDYEVSEVAAELLVSNSSDNQNFFLDPFCDLLDQLRVLADNDNQLETVCFFSDDKRYDFIQLNVVMAEGSVLVNDIIAGGPSQKKPLFSDLKIADGISIKDLFFQNSRETKLNQVVTVSGLKIKMINPYMDYYIVMAEKDSVLWSVDYVNGEYVINEY